MFSNDFTFLYIPFLAPSLDRCDIYLGFPYFSSVPLLGGKDTGKLIGV